MSEDQPPNGADAGEPRERPSWYIPLQPIPEDDKRTLTEVLLATFGHEPLELPEDVQEELLAYLNQFRVPRES